MFLRCGVYFVLILVCWFDCYFAITGLRLLFCFSYLFALTLVGYYVCAFRYDLLRLVFGLFTWCFGYLCFVSFDLWFWGCLVLFWLFWVYDVFVCALLYFFWVCYGLFCFVIVLLMLGSIAFDLVIVGGLVWVCVVGLICMCFSWYLCYVICCRFVCFWLLWLTFVLLLLNCYDL